MASSHPEEHLSDDWECISCTDDAQERTHAGTLSSELRQLMGNPAVTNQPLTAYLAATHPDDRQSVESALTELASGGGSRTLDHRFVGFRREAKV